MDGATVLEPAVVRLATLLTRYETLPASARTAMWVQVEQTAAETDADMRALEERMSKQRDWLDSHRNDPRYAIRKARFIANEVRQHAEHGTALERYAGRLGHGLGYRWSDDPEPGADVRGADGGDADVGTASGPGPVEASGDASMVRAEPTAPQGGGAAQTVLGRRLRGGARSVPGAAGGGPTLHDGVRTGTE